MEKTQNESTPPAKTAAGGCSDEIVAVLVAYAGDDCTDEIVGVLVAYDPATPDQSQQILLRSMGSR